MNESTPTILKKILARKQEEVASRRVEVPIEKLINRADDQPACRGFVSAMERRIALGQAAVIAEIKKASPSQGVIRQAFQPIDIAESYEAGGAACLSVLTDIDFFQGADHYLTAARNAVSLPVIRKDFIIDEYQVYEARAIGADCILLIVAALDFKQLEHLNSLALELGMDVLVEVHDEQELDQALMLPNRLIGINNRNLHTFATSLDTTYSLLEKIDQQKHIVVTESGIRTREHVTQMRNHDVHGFLIGETFMRAENPGSALNDLFTNEVMSAAI